MIYEVIFEVEDEDDDESRGDNQVITGGMQLPVLCGR